MELTLNRHWFSALSTIGELSIDGAFECFVLEDKMRELAGVPVEKWKVKGRTAIPTGRYQVVISHSFRFDRDLPRLLNVPGFEGILIHPGNTASDTEGCLLPGRARLADKVIESRVAFAGVFGKLRAAQDPIWITVKNSDGE